MMRLSLLMFFFSFLFFNCNTVKYTVKNLPSKQLIFGEGGGFSGAVKEFILLENGQVFSRANLSDINEELKCIGSSKAKKIFKKLDDLNFTKTDFIYPGNLYHFIQLQTDSVTNHRVVWGDAKNQVPEPIKALYEELKKLPKPAKKKSN